MIVSWSGPAFLRICDIYEYIAQDHPPNAALVVSRIHERVGLLRYLPNAGTPRRYGRSSLREVIEHPFRVLYRVDPGMIFVVGIVHTRRRMPVRLSDW